MYNWESKFMVELCWNPSSYLVQSMYEDTVFCRYPSSASLLSLLVTYPCLCLCLCLWVISTAEMIVLLLLYRCFRSPWRLFAIYSLRWGQASPPWVNPSSLYFVLLSYPQLADINIDIDLRRTSSLKVRAGGGPRLTQVICARGCTEWRKEK